MTSPRDQARFAREKLDEELEALRHERKGLARELKEYGAAIEDLEPEDCDEHVREMRRLVDSLEEWGAQYRSAKAERAEYGP